MSSVHVTIQELFESGQSPSKIWDLLKRRASRSGVYKILKRLKVTGSALSKVRSAPSRKVRKNASVHQKHHRDQKKSSNELLFKWSYCSSEATVQVKLLFKWRYCSSDATVQVTLLLSWKWFLNCCWGDAVVMKMHLCFHLKYVVGLKYTVYGYCLSLFVSLYTLSLSSLFLRLFCSQSCRSNIATVVII